MEKDFHVELSSNKLNETMGVEFFGNDFNLFDVSKQSQQDLFVNVLIDFLINIKRFDFQILGHGRQVLPSLLFIMQGKLIVTHFIMILVSVIDQ